MVAVSQWQARFLYFCKNFIQIMGALVINPVNNYLFKVNNRNTRERCERCLKLTIKIAMRFTHWFYHSLMGNQFTVSNSFWDICATLSNCRQKRMHLFCEVWILFFSFLERLGYHAELVKLKQGCIKALSKRRRFAVKYLIFRIC